MIVKLEEDPETGDLLLPISLEVLESCGWKEGDTLEWVDNSNGTWSIRKVQEEQEYGNLL